MTAIKAFSETSDSNIKPCNYQERNPELDALNLYKEPRWQIQGESGKLPEAFNTDLSITGLDCYSTAGTDRSQNKIVTAPESEKPNSITSAPEAQPQNKIVTAPESEKPNSITSAPETQPQNKIVTAPESEKPNSITSAPDTAKRGQVEHQSEHEKSQQSQEQRLKPNSGTDHSQGQQPKPESKEKQEAAPPQQDNPQPKDQIQPSPGNEAKTPESGDTLPPLPHEGESIQKLDPQVNPRLGCAVAVSGALHEIDPSFPITSNNKQLEKLLQEHGYEVVSRDGGVSQDKLQPNDVLIGQRPDGMPGHSAIYKGQGKLYENDSETGTISGNGSLDKFNNKMHDENGRWNKNGFDEVLVFRKKDTSKPATEAGQGTFA
jgi:hypothetical protein